MGQYRNRCGSLATFLLVLIAWVFFRMNELPDAITYLQCMFSKVQIQPSTDLIAGILYQPYYLLVIGHSVHCRLAFSTDVGLDATVDTSQNRGMYSSALVISCCFGNAGV